MLALPLNVELRLFWGEANCPMTLFLFAKSPILCSFEPFCKGDDPTKPAGVFSFVMDSFARVVCFPCLVGESRFAPDFSDLSLESDPALGFWMPWARLPTNPFRDSISAYCWERLSSKSSDSSVTVSTRVGARLLSRFSCKACELVCFQNTCSFFLASLGSLSGY